ncbi:MAG: glycosyltransferase [Candidatus Acidiferrum sp.]
MPTKITILMPVYEDWDSALSLCQKIDQVFLAHADLHISLLIVDDGTSVGNIPAHAAFVPKAIKSISTLVLRRNLGHQRAIAVGLAYIQQNLPCDALVVMDADGEDRPEDIPVLLEAMKNSPKPTAVFAERGKRLENGAFRLFYQVYRALHRVFTGRDIRFGNFSALPWSHLESLVVFPELWNHYAATFVKSRLPYVRIRLNRDARLAGHSRMDLVSLVVHGLSALFANQEVHQTARPGLAANCHSGAINRRSGRDQTTDESGYPRLGHLHHGHLAYPRQSVTHCLFHTSFFHHDEPQPPGIFAHP